MRVIPFSDGDLAAIARDRYPHPHPRVPERMDVLWLTSRGAGHAASLGDYFLAHPARSTAEAQAAIERLTGVRRGLTQVRQFLKNLSACAGGRSARSRPRPTRRPRPSSSPPR